MTEITQPIPARLRNVAVNGHVAGAADIIDDNLNKTQDEINQQVAEIGDKPYAPTEFSGMGRKALPKNIQTVGGEEKNVLTQEMMPLATGQNTIYVIQYDYTLEGQTITMPANCVLEFDGGSLDNGVLIGNKTAIDAPSGKIFGDNLALFKYGFFKSSSENPKNVANSEIPLDYVESNGIVNLDTVVINTNELQQITGRTYTEKIVTDGYERMSNANNNGIVQPIGTTLNINTDCILENKIKASFNQYHNASIVINGLNNTQVCYLTSSSEGVFTVPAKSHFIYYTNNGVQKLNPGDTANENDIWVSYTSRLVALVDKSTFVGKGKLSWFIGNDFTTDIGALASAPDVTKNIQKAFLCSMDIESDVHGFIRIEDSIYAETAKVIHLGNNTDTIGAVQPLSSSNAKLNKNFNYQTVFYTIGCNKPLLYVRIADLKIYGGCFSAQYATTHTSSICAIDGDYGMGNVELDTISFIGKKNVDNTLSTSKGIDFIVEGRGTGYMYASRFKCFIADCKYGVYMDMSNAGSVSINSNTFDINVWGFFEALYMNGASMSTVKFTAQSTNCIPLGEEDNCRPARFTNVTGVTVDGWIWDTNSEKKNVNPTKNYRKALFLGNGELIGRSKYNIEGRWDYNYTYSSQSASNDDIPYENRVYRNAKLNNLINYAYINIAQPSSGNSLAQTYCCLYPIREGFDTVNIPTADIVDNTPTPDIIYSWAQFRQIFDNTNKFSQVAYQNNKYIEICIRSKEGKLFDQRYSAGSIMYKYDSINTYFKNYQIIACYDGINKDIVSGTIDNDYGPGLKTINFSTSLRTGLTWLVIRLWNPYIESESAYVPKIAIWANDINAEIYGQTGELPKNFNLTLVSGDVVRYNGSSNVYTLSGRALFAQKNVVNINSQDETQVLTIANRLSDANEPNIVLLHCYNNGRMWVYNPNYKKLFNLDDTKATLRGVGTTEQRPTTTINGESLSEGTYYFDTTLGKPIYWHNNNWVDALGNPVNTTYNTGDLSNYVQKSQTNGLLKNDGSVDITTYQEQVSGTAGNLAGFDANGKLADSGSKPSDFEPASA